MLKIRLRISISGAFLVALGREKDHHIFSSYEVKISREFIAEETTQILNKDYPSKLTLSPHKVSARQVSMILAPLCKSPVRVDSFPCFST